MRVDPRADRDIDEHFAFISRESLDVAMRFLDATNREFERLARSPGLGSTCETRSPRLTGLRVWPISGFDRHLIFYRPISEGIEIVRVLHGARNIDRIIAAVDD